MANTKKQIKRVSRQTSKGSRVNFFLNPELRKMLSDIQDPVIDTDSTTLRKLIKQEYDRQNSKDQVA